MQDQSLNFRVSVNSDRLGIFLDQAYAANTLLLPNLYYTERAKQAEWHPPAKLLKIGSFGAIRLLKNHISSAAASLMIASTYKKDLQFYISVSRVENGKGVIDAIRNMFSSVNYAKLIEIPWSDWSDFTRIIENLDLHMQMSFTETFNLTTADACSVSVPTVSSDAIEWIPQSYIANADDPQSIAQTGWTLINNPQAGRQGLAALQNYNSTSIDKWVKWLDGNNSTMTNYFLR
jgi:hypothetical protein